MTPEVHLLLHSRFGWSTADVDALPAWLLPALLGGGER